MSASTTNNDYELKDMKRILLQNNELGRVTGKPLMDGHFKNLLKNTIIDRCLRESFINSIGKRLIETFKFSFRMTINLFFLLVTKYPHNYCKFVIIFDFSNDNLLKLTERPRF